MDRSTTVQPTLLGRGNKLCKQNKHVATHSRRARWTLTAMETHQLHFQESRHRRPSRVQVSKTCSHMHPAAREMWPIGYRSSPHSQRQVLTHAAHVAWSTALRTRLRSRQRPLARAHPGYLALSTMTLSSRRSRQTPLRSLSSFQGFRVTMRASLRRTGRLGWRIARRKDVHLCTRRSRMSLRCCLQS